MLKIIKGGLIRRKDVLDRIDSYITILENENFDPMLTCTESVMIADEKIKTLSIVKELIKRI